MILLHSRKRVSMDRTPGFLDPSKFPSEEALEKELQRQAKAFGFTPFNVDEFLHSSGGGLVHYGVKGMHWGVRHDHPSGVSKKTDREARKDAHEFARAKQFYGEGAGTRRKLIKATVEGKSKRDPSYKEAFDRHLANQDMSEHAAKARSERKRKNAKKSVGRGVRGTRHVLNGNSQYASAAVAVGVGGAMWAHKAGIDKVVLDAGKTAYSKASNSSKTKSAKRLLDDLGIG